MYDFDEHDTFRFRSPHGMKTARGRLRNISGIEVRHLQHSNHPGRAWHDLSSERSTLTVVLAEVSGTCEARVNLRRAAPLDRQRPNHISFIPAHLKVWGYTDNIKSVRELRLSFDTSSLTNLLGEELDPTRTNVPELMFQERRAVECARLLAAECDSARPASRLYGEGLVLALLSTCFQRRSDKNASGLSAAHLRLVSDFMQAHLAASVSLPEIARLVDLSPSHFARMFKRSTGVAPHRFLMNARISRAQELLLERDANLARVAAATGFADQSHFTRVFKTVIGVTPQTWLDDRR